MNNLKCGNKKPCLSDSLLAQIVPLVDESGFVDQELLSLFFKSKKFRIDKKQQITSLLNNVRLQGFPSVSSNPCGFIKENFYCDSDTEFVNLSKILIEMVGKVKETKVIEANSDVLKSLWLINTKSEHQIKTNFWKNRFLISHLDVLKTVYSFAEQFITQIRPGELPLFLSQFPNSESIQRCFISLYEAGKLCGVPGHCDWISFCTVSICLSADVSDDGCLRLSKNKRPSQTDIKVKLNYGDLVCYGRDYHSVDFFARRKDRCTLNFFL